MSMRADRPSEPGMRPAKPRPRRRIPATARLLIALVSCCGVLFFIWKVVIGETDPAKVAAHALQVGSASERVDAVRELEQLGVPEKEISIPSLIAAIGDADDDVRVEASEALGRVVATLARSGFGEEEVRAGEKALLGALKDRQARVRVASVLALGPLADDSKAVIAAVIEMLGDPESRVRIAAAQVLSSRAAAGGPEVISTADLRRVVAVLMEGLAAPEADERIAATEILQALISAMRAQSSIDFRPAVAEVAKRLEDPEAGVRLAAAKAVGAIAITEQGTELFDLDKVVAALAKGLGDPDAEVRWVMIRVLEVVGSGALVEPAPALGAALEDPIAKNRAAAATALGKFQRGLDPFIPALLRTLEHDADPMVRNSCATAPMGPPQASAAVIPVLIQGLESRDGEVRCAAAAGLEQFGDEARAAVPALIAVAKDPTPFSRLNPETDRGLPADRAIRALGRIAPDTPSAEAAVAALIEALPSKSHLMRSEAAFALSQFGGKAAGAIPRLQTLSREDSNPDVRSAATGALARIKGG